MKTLHDLVADKIENDPTLLRIPLDNIDRWVANGHTAPHRLEQWRQIIHRAQQSPEGFAALLALLRERSESAQRLRDFAPFAGTLTRDERAAKPNPNAPTISIKHLKRALAKHWAAREKQLEAMGQWRPF